MSIVVKKTGIFDVFQDLGRTGYQKLGINPNGAMDTAAVRTANILLRNPENTAALEMNFPAADLEFRRRISFVISGADFGAELDDRQIDCLRIVTAKRGSILKFSKPVSGKRAYLSVRNGFRLDQWLFSTSTNTVAAKSGFEGRSLKKGDAVMFVKPETLAADTASGLRPEYSNSPLLKFVPGPSFCDLTAMSELSLRRVSYLVGGDSNRMGFRLTGPPLHLLSSEQILSSAVTFGTIQLLPNGQLVVLMADHQTSGGYPNIGTIITTDLPIAAQLGSGDKIRFEPCSSVEAEKSALDLEDQFRFLKTGLKLRDRLL
jgi:antagonist of KipI